MKSIQETIQFDQDIHSSKKNSLDALCKDPSIVSFMKENQLTREMMDDYWLELLNYQEDYPACIHCSGLNSCPKKLVGYRRKLNYLEGQVTVVVEACDYQKQLEEDELINRRISTNLPKRLLDIKVDTVQSINANLLLHFLQYLKKVSESGLDQQGMYISGPTQSGKTVSLGYFAKRMARAGYTIGFYNVPALMGQLKSSFNDEEASTTLMISQLKNVDILILDDLGGENFSNWSRDEVLGTIIEERLLNQKPIIYSSVYDFNDLVEYYVSSKNKTELMKVTKLVEKIKQNTMHVEM